MPPRVAPNLQPQVKNKGIKPPKKPRKAQLDMRRREAERLRKEVEAPHASYPHGHRVE